MLTLLSITESQTLSRSNSGQLTSPSSVETRTMPQMDLIITH